VNKQIQTFTLFLATLPLDNTALEILIIKLSFKLSWKTKKRIN